MTLGLRKLAVAFIVAGILLVGNILAVAHWLQETGAIEGARHLREEFLTGTAITVLAALFFLLVPDRGLSARRRCPVCDSGISGKANYCQACGSRV
jgi:hypothetical protein